MTISLKASVERYGPGQDATEFEPGDFILTHRHQVDAWFITQAQARRFRGSDAPYAHWSHAALVVGRDGALVEAKKEGVVRSPISIYHADEYHMVRIGPEFTTEARAKAVAYAGGRVGQAFGYLDITGACLDLLFGLRLRWVRRNHEMCSSLVVAALQRGGLLQALDPALTLPADLAKTFEVREVGP